MYLISVPTLETVNKQHLLPKLLRLIINLLFLLIRDKAKSLFNNSNSQKFNQCNTDLKIFQLSYLLSHILNDNILAIISQNRNLTSIALILISSSSINSLLTIDYLYDLKEYLRNKKIATDR